MNSEPSKPPESDTNTENTNSPCPTSDVPNFGTSRPKKGTYRLHAHPSAITHGSQLPLHLTTNGQQVANVRMPGNVMQGQTGYRQPYYHNQNQRNVTSSYQSNAGYQQPAPYFPPYYPVNNQSQIVQYPIGQNQFQHQQHQSLPMESFPYQGNYQHQNHQSWNGQEVNQPYNQGYQNNHPTQFVQPYWNQPMASFQQQGNPVITHNAPLEAVTDPNQNVIPAVSSNNPGLQCDVSKDSSYERRVGGKLDSILQTLEGLVNSNGRLEKKVDSIEKRMDTFQDQFSQNNLSGNVVGSGIGTERSDVSETVENPPESENQPVVNLQTIQVEFPVEPTRANALTTEIKETDTVTMPELLDTTPNHIERPRALIQAVQNNTKVLSNTAIVDSMNARKPEPTVFSPNSIFRDEDFPALSASLPELKQRTCMMTHNPVSPVASRELRPIILISTLPIPMLYTSESRHSRIGRTQSLTPAVQSSQKQGKIEPKKTQPTQIQPIATDASGCSHASETPRNSDNATTVVAVASTSQKSSTSSQIKPCTTDVATHARVSGTLKNLENVTTVASDRQVLAASGQKHNTNDRAGTELVASTSQKQLDAECIQVMSRKNKRKNKKKLLNQHKETAISSTSDILEPTVEGSTPDSMSKDADEAEKSSLSTVSSSVVLAPIFITSTAPDPVNMKADRVEKRRSSNEPSLETVTSVEERKELVLTALIDPVLKAMSEGVADGNSVQESSHETKESIASNVVQAETVSTVESSPIRPASTSNPAAVVDPAVVEDTASILMKKEAEADIEPSSSHETTVEAIPSVGKVLEDHIDPDAEHPETPEDKEEIEEHPRLSKKQRKRIEKEARDEEKARARMRKEAERSLARQQKKAAEEEAKKKREEEELAQKEEESCAGPSNEVAKPAESRAKTSNKEENPLATVNWDVFVTSAIFATYHVATWIEKQTVFRTTEAFRTVSPNMTQLESILFYTDSKQNRFDSCRNPTAYFKSRTDFWRRKEDEAHQMIAALFISLASSEENIIRWDGFCLMEASAGLGPKQMFRNDMEYAFSILRSTD